MAILRVAHTLISKTKISQVLQIMQSWKKDTSCKPPVYSPFQTSKMKYIINCVRSRLFEQRQETASFFTFTHLTERLFLSSKTC